MTVRIRCGRLTTVAVTLAADLLIAGGMVAVLISAWGLSEGLLYQTAQKALFESESGPASAGNIVSVEPGVESTSTDAEAPAVPEIPLPAIHPASAVSRSRKMLAAVFARDPLLLGELEIPRVNLKVMLREGADAETLRKAVGHLPASALPGEPGNFVLYGHRDTFFRPLRNIEAGDSMYVRTPAGFFTYRVVSMEVVSPDFVRIERSETPIATLITCYPFTYIGPAPRRFVVHARLMSTQPSSPRQIPLDFRYTRADDSLGR
jgi:sortase A